MEKMLKTYPLVIKQDAMPDYWFSQLKAWKAPTTSWYSKVRDVRRQDAGILLSYGDQKKFIDMGYSIAAWPFKVNFDHSIVATIEGDECEFTDEQMCWLFGCYTTKYDTKNNPMFDENGASVYNWDEFQLRNQILTNFKPYQRGVMMFFFNEEELLYTCKKKWFVGLDITL